MAYDYSPVDWDGFRDHLRDVPWEDIFNSVLLLLLVNFVSGTHRKYQIKPHSPPWFSAACAAAIVHRDHFFHLYQQNKSYETKVKFRQAGNLCKRVLEAAKLAYATKTRVRHFPETWLLRLFANC